MQWKVSFWNDSYGLFSTYIIHSDQWKIIQQFWPRKFTFRNVSSYFVLAHKVETFARKSIKTPKFGLGAIRKIGLSPQIQTWGRLVVDFALIYIHIQLFPFNVSAIFCLKNYFCILSKDRNQSIYLYISRVSFWNITITTVLARIGKPPSIKEKYSFQIFKSLI